MEQDDIKALQVASEFRYKESPEGSANEAVWMQNRLLAEVALQLAKIQEQLGFIVNRMENPD